MDPYYTNLLQYTYLNILNYCNNSILIQDNFELNRKRMSKLTALNNCTMKYLLCCKIFLKNDVNQIDLLEFLKIYYQHVYIYIYKTYVCIIEYIHLI